MRHEPNSLPHAVFERTMNLNVSAEELYSAVYQQLKRMARKQLRNGRGKVTINTTELVHEAFLKLGHEPESWESRAHFFGAASRAMREVLVDFARRRGAVKRGAGWEAVSLSEADKSLQVESDNVLSLDRALDQLDALDQRLRHVVELRFFGGVPEQDIARMLGVSTRTVERDWLKARMFLLQAMEPATQ
jgi:RNA polymerase sigma factor (TIGR02999 family)